MSITSGMVGTNAELDFTRYEGIGLASKAAWYVAAILYGTGGVFFMFAWLVEGWVPASAGVLATIAVILSIAFLAGARWKPHLRWGAQFRIGCGTAIILVGEVLVGPSLSPFALYILYPLLAVVYLYEARISFPFLLFCTVATAAALSGFSGDPTAHTIVTATMLLAICVATTLSQREIRMIARINRRLSVVDPLTGVANVRRLRELVAETIGGRRADDGRPALFAIDLDDFKLVNDRFSHSLGDKVLRSVARSVECELVSDDVLARRGGDEFSILVRSSADRDLNDLARRVKLAVHGARLDTCPEISPSGSVGYVVYETGESAEQFLMRGDDALHEAKLDAHPERRDRPNDGGKRRPARDPSTQEPLRREADNGDDGRVDDLQIARAIKRTLGHASSWQVVAILIASAVCALVASALTSTGRELVAPIPMAAIVALAAISAISLAMSRRDSGELPMHVVLFATTTLITLTVLTVTHERSSLADIYLVPVVAAFYCFKPHRAAPWLVVGIGLFSVALLTSPYDFAAPRIGLTAVITLVLVAMLAKARSMARQFIAHAVDLSIIDPLTGARNLRGLHRGVAEAIESCEDGEKRVAMLAIDLDDFKSVNDNHSHTLGDKTLVAVTLAINDVTRASDLIARRGGDEFAVLMMIEDESEVARLATRVSSCIADARLAISPDITPTASVGTVIWNPGEGAEEFLERADGELHVAKMAEYGRRDAGVVLRSA
jgi:diguanylate cyclase (GGDEF)-like protein